MKNRNIILAALVSLLTITTISSIDRASKAKAATLEMQERAEQEKIEAAPEKHLILNADGSYGGTLNASKYGEGAPLNGKLDHMDSPYWSKLDFYNATSNDTRTMVHNFSTYQQTMKDSGGIACALMTMYNLGYTDTRIYSEERLVKKYELLNGTSVYNNGVTDEGLANLFTSYGLFAEADAFKKSGNSRNINGINKFIEDNLKNDLLTLLPFWADDGYHWYVVIGVDTKYQQLIYADPFDAFDHYQDGYKLQATKNMYNFWLNLTPGKDVYLKNDKDAYTYTTECVVVKAPEGMSLDIAKGEVEVLQPLNTEFPENHNLQNANGKYGGGMVDSATNAHEGTKPWGNYAEWATFADAPTENFIDTPYYKFTDYYYFDDEYNNGGSRIFLNHYRTKQQTTASTCGICSTLSAMVYYGVPYDENSRDVSDYSGTISEYKLMKQVEKLEGITVYNRGVANYEIATLVKKYGYTVDHSAGYNMTNVLKSGTSKMVYPTYEKFTAKLTSDLKNDRPWLMGWKVGGGHWEVIFGYDDMGTPEPYDDIAIFADSHDTADNLRDGYNTYSGMWAYNHWYNGSHHWNQQGIVFH